MLDYIVRLLSREHSDLLFDAQQFLLTYALDAE